MLELLKRVLHNIKGYTIYFKNFLYFTMNTYNAKKNVT